MKKPLNIRRIPNLGHLYDKKDAMSALHARVAAMRDYKTAQTSKLRADAESRFGGLPLGPAEKQQLIRATVNNGLAEIMRNQHENLKPIMHDIGSVKELVDAGRDAYTNRIRLLDLTTLHSAKRATYAQNLQRAGDMSLTHAAEEAIARNDPDLAAAVISVLGSRKPTHRPFTPAEVANAVSHAESIDRPMQAFLDMEQQLNEAMSMCREMTQPDIDSARRVGGTERIKQGLARRNAQPRLASEDDLKEAANQAKKAEQLPKAGAN